MIFISLVLCALFDMYQPRKYSYKLVPMGTPRDHSMVKKYLLKPSKTKSNSALCKLPKNVGLCRQSKLRFYYNSIACKCRPFIYTGCRGNKNNFRSIAACEKTCQI
ncbi:unnamed protein product [Adineta ricciae]|uniref:BPTI/Kunitz inhibitor domain-containing protein n=1 Tax=Adineta ricciae TaxID=249248 RepID=A0A814QEH4_ADIRI|nr:unnamed protein product [Adineta ricciae]